MAESDLNHPGRARAASAVRFRGRLRRFLRTTRAGATAIVALGVSAITVGASALIVDHNWLLDQRDVLKHASDAAAVAASIELERHKGTSTQDELAVQLKEAAHTYAVLNLQFLSGDRLTRANDTLAVETTPYIDENRVDVAISADLGGTLFSRHLPITGGYTGPEAVAAGSGVEILLAPVEVVLAIDASGSMRQSLSGGIASSTNPSRIDIVKAAARNLVDALNPNSENRIAVALLPWHNTVRLKHRLRERWESKGWALFPTSRHYPAIYKCTPQLTCRYTSQDQSMPPTSPEEWKSCLDETRVSMVGHASHAEPSEWFTPPSELAFAQAIFPGALGTAYDCLTPPLPSNYGGQSCYSDGEPAQSDCFDRAPRIVPLTSDRVVIDNAINNLRAEGTDTYSSLGLLWGQRLLTPSWNDVWLGGVHPVDPDIPANKGMRKAVVLLTDGDDTRCGGFDRQCERSNVGIPRSLACDAVKAQGTEIFVIAAIDGTSQSLADGLLACSSQAERPEGNYAFLDHTDEESLREAFTEIANQLIVVRRTY